jgi:hypothetical protein
MPTTARMLKTAGPAKADAKNRGGTKEGGNYRNRWNVNNSRTPATAETPTAAWMLNSNNFLRNTGALQSKNVPW